jgi:CRP-like cAMP-binding protein
MRTLDQVVAEAPVFGGLSADSLELVAGCASTARFRPGEYLLREDEPAERFYLVRDGTVALETWAPGQGALVIQTLGPGELVGWSWLFPPYRSHFDARAVELVRAVGFDGGCLRGKCEDDHDLGYDLLTRFAQVLIERLQSTRLRLLDVYGDAATG